MPKQPAVITLPLPMRMGSVNCYLLETQSGFILIDTGGKNNRQQLLYALERAGCRPGSLRLIILTHGDFDHIGNAAALRSAYQSSIAMGAGDLGMAEDGDMFAGRTRPNAVIRKLMPLFYSLRDEDRFTPDRLFQEGDDLSGYGLGAQINSIPGHSSGSIGVLTDEGGFFCGDLLVNSKNPTINTLIDNLAAAEASLLKLKNLPIRTVYPGHGLPFTLDQLETPRDDR